jgi:hypothetical protein
MLQTVPGGGYRLLGYWTIRRDTVPAKPKQARSAPSAFRTNVPAAGTPLIGRETAVLRLCHLLSA